MGKDNLSSLEPVAERDSLEQLYQLARKEGEVICNVGGGEDDPWRGVVDKFKVRFPGVTLKFVTIGPTIGRRLRAEYEANKVSIDCSSTGMSTFLPQIERGLITRHDWTRFNVKKEDIVLDGLGLLLFELAWIFFYNTDAISPEEAPRTWEDLLNPRWKGKILILSAVNNVTVPGIIWPREKAEAYITALGKQAEPAARGRHIREKVAGGEYLIGNGVLKSILTLHENRVPVQALPIGPAQIIQQIFWTFERCPHPNAARLLGAWLASDEGTETLKTMGFEKLEPLAASRQGQALLEMGMKLEYARTIPESKVRAELGKRYAELMGFTTRA